MFDIIFNEFGVAWTAAAVGTLLVPVMLLVAWKTAALLAETLSTRRPRHAHAHAAAAPLRAPRGPLASSARPSRSRRANLALAPRRRERRSH